MATQSNLPSLSQAVEIYYDELKQFVMKRTGSSTIAEDVVQETWIRANNNQIITPDNPKAYLFSMANNLAIDHLRKIKPTTTTPLENQIELNCDAPQPLESAISTQELNILLDAVQALPDKCKQAFLLYRGQDLTMREVAQNMGISEKTVEKHIAKAMLHCRQKLRQAGRNV
ncbi:RNA polymerase sigma factor [Catenovulum sp. 2E275]|uniref:RNA polymerase sigma factor n=1 Tax=Catenovulum sp. 2E275 TaxID=2980497 RepID=UPI0021D1AD29|nr:RNA polymerase sigma factor [Catenovulum sp. 2E275]MCU4675222.1 RNA polymerase sigma factor [Catenovulum sp. 2E275]